MEAGVRQLKRRRMTLATLSFHFVRKKKKISICPERRLTSEGLYNYQKHSFKGHTGSGETHFLCVGKGEMLTLS